MQPQPQPQPEPQPKRQRQQQQPQPKQQQHTQQHTQQQQQRTQQQQPQHAHTTQQHTQQQQQRTQQQQQQQQQHTQTHQPQQQDGPSEGGSDAHQHKTHQYQGPGHVAVASASAILFEAAAYAPRTDEHYELELALNSLQWKRRWRRLWRWARQQWPKRQQEAIPDQELSDLLAMRDREYDNYESAQWDSDPDESWEWHLANDPPIREACEPGQEIIPD